MIALTLVLGLQQTGGAWTVDTSPNVGGSLSPMAPSMLAHGPDLDLDGFAEILVGGTSPNALYCLSARSGAIHWTYYPPFGTSSEKTVASVPDVNGDGAEEVVVGFPGFFQGPQVNMGRVCLLDGRTGVEIRHHDGSTNAFSSTGETLGFVVLGIQDMDGDGKGEYLSGAPFSDRSGFLGYLSGAVYCWSGATGSLLWIQNGQTEELYGFSLSHGPDLTNDGRAEILVGSPARPTSARPPGLVAVLDGSSGALLSELLGSNYLVGTRSFGNSVNLLPDLDEDGIEDIFVGAYTSWVHGVQESGEAFVISGATGGLIWSAAGTQPSQWFGYAGSASSDLDEDGVTDVAISAPYEALTPGGYEGRVYLHSGADGSSLGVLESTAGYVRLGFGSALLHHRVPGRSEPVLLIGEAEGRLSPSTPVGLLWPYTFSPFLRADVHALSAAAGRDVRLRLDFPSSEAGRPYAILVSGSGTGPTNLGGIQIPLTADAWFQRSVQGPIPPLLHRARGILDADGDARAGLRAGPGALSSQIGRTLHFAAVTGSSGALAWSSIAVELRIEP